MDLDLTAAKADERKNLLGRLLPGRVYVTDRGYAGFVLLQAILDLGSWFVCRLRDHSVYEVLEERPLTTEAQSAGVLCDQIVWLGGKDHRRDLKQPVRILQIACKPHYKRGEHGGDGGPAQGKYLLIATNLLELPAGVVALIYRQRWTIELFFRFFKHILGCRHLLSHRPNGIQIQVYAPGNSASTPARNGITTSPRSIAAGPRGGIWNTSAAIGRWRITATGKWM